MGNYPDIGLAEAVAKRDEASNQVANGVSSKQQKQLKKKGLSNQFLFVEYGERYYNEVIKKYRKS